MLPNGHRAWVREPFPPDAGLWEGQQLNKGRFLNLLAEDHAPEVKLFTVGCNQGATSERGSQSKHRRCPTAHSHQPRAGLPTHRLIPPCFIQSSREGINNKFK